MNSFSWSVNVCGSKRWRFLPAAETSLLRDVFGEDVASSFGPSSPTWPRRGRARPIEVVQRPGEAIFVPSGWYHDCVEINQWVRLRYGGTVASMA